MTEKEIQRLLDMLDKKGLEETKKFLLKEKNKSRNEKKVEVFEDYITNRLVKPNDISLNGTYYSEENGRLVYTNGISIYYVNPELKELLMPSILKHSTTNIIQNYYQRVRLMDNEKLSTISKKVALYENSFTLAKFNRTVHGKSELLDVFLSKDDTEFIFSSREIMISNIILDNPEYEIGIHEPIIRASTQLGKVYILGYKR